MKFIRLLCTVLLASVLFPSTGFSQDAPPSRYLRLEYMKSEPGKAAEYLRLIRGYWIPIQQARVAANRIASWKFYSVSYPNGASTDYDYVVITEFAKFADMEAPYAGIDQAKILGEAKHAELQRLNSTVRRMVRAETMVVQLSTEGWSKARNQIILAHYLQSLPGKAADLLKVQREFYHPSGQEMVASGNTASWLTGAIRYPENPDHPYNHISFNGYESLTQIEKATPQAWRDKWSGEKSAQNNIAVTAARKRIKGEMWRLIVQTAPGT